MSLRIPIDGNAYEAKNLYLKTSLTSPIYRVVKIIAGAQTQWYTLKYAIRNSITNGTCTLPSEMSYGTPIEGYIVPSTYYTYPSSITVKGVDREGNSTGVTYTYNNTTGRITISAAGVGTVSIYVTAACASATTNNRLHLTIVAGDTETTDTYIVTSDSLTLIPCEPPTGYGFPEIIMIDGYVGSSRTQAQGTTTTWTWTPKSVGSGYNLIIQSDVSDFSGRILCRPTTLTAPEASLIRDASDNIYIIDTDGRADSYGVYVDGVDTGTTIQKC